MRSTIIRLKTGRAKRTRDGVVCDYLVRFDHGKTVKGAKVKMTKGELVSLLHQINRELD